jgi:hypothetical protein
VANTKNVQKICKSFNLAPAHILLPSCLGQAAASQKTTSLDYHTIFVDNYGSCSLAKLRLALVQEL